jgi:glycosyltransferase involved in cell wall biosynthesis
MAVGMPESEVIRLSREYDIVNVHWVNYFLSVQSLWSLAQTGKPMVITLHDENLFTGGCHYTGACDGYLHTCAQCPKLDVSMRHIPPLELANKIHYIPRHATIICPSRWLAEKAAKSKVLSGHEIRVIPNGLDASLYTPDGRDAQRKILGAKEKHMVILFGAQSLDDRRKGMGMIPAILNEFRNGPFRDRLSVYAFGNIPADPVRDVHYLGPIHDEARLAALYAAADVVLLPSLDDNLPNVMLESLLCGTPVAAFDAGGIPEGIISGHNGKLVPVGDTGALARAAESVAFHSNIRAFCRDDAVNRFSLDVVVPKYKSLFKEKKSKPAAEMIFEPNALHYAMASIIEKPWRMHFSDWAREKEQQWIKRLHRAVQCLFEAKANGKIVVLYGMGKYGRLLDACCQGIVNFTVDGNPDIWDDHVFSPEILTEKNPDDLCILISAIENAQIEEKLESYGFEKEKHFLCVSDFANEKNEVGF